VIQLLEDPIQRIEMGERGKAYVTAHAAWSVRAVKMAGIVEGAVARSSEDVRPKADKSGARPMETFPPSAVEGGR
jgi:hypothetical protein